MKEVAMSPTSTEQELIQLETQFWQAMQDKDADTAMRLTDDLCIVTGAQGVAQIDRQSMGAMLLMAGWTLEHFELGDDLQVRLLSDDVALIAYQVHEDLTVEGKPLSIDAADSSTWVRRDGHWLCAMHTEALAGDPFGRDHRMS